jgi:hypothetical protein
MIIIQDFGVYAIPTVPGPPPKLHSDPTPLEAFRAKACFKSKTIQRQGSIIYASGKI